MYVVSHEDDDLLFCSTDLLHDIQAGRQVVTVFLTSGDAGLDAAYWHGRERGIESSYAQMAGVAEAWTSATAGTRGLLMRTLNAKPTISVVFLRLPDGFPLGTGSSAYGWQSLQRLYEGNIADITAVDGSQTYTRADLVATLGELMTQFGPTDIHVQDYVGQYLDGDHSDHHTAAYLARDAAADYAAAHTLYSHLGYLIAGKADDLAGDDVIGKTDAFNAYSVFDSQIRSGEYIEYLTRQYLADAAATGPDGSENLIARATITASSENTATGQTADKVADGSLSGYPDDPGGEWATVGGAAGSWLQLSWATPVRLGLVVLFDRPNLDDQVTQGRLVFSDGTSVPTGALDNRGFRTDISFPPRNVTSVRLQIDAVSATTVNVGLAEFQAWGVGAPSDL